MAVVGGRSDGGRRAGASHTAAAATPAVGVAALFAQAGVIGCDDADDLAETALLLTLEPLPMGPRLGVVSNAGGMGVLAADAATARGLLVPEFTPEIRSTIAGHVLGTTGTSNPVDAGAAIAPDALAAIVETLLVSGEVDALLVELVATSLSDLDSAVSALAAVRTQHAHLPLVLVAQGMGHALADARGLTTYRSTAAAARALGRAAKYAAWLADRTGDVEADLVQTRQAGTLQSLLQRQPLGSRGSGGGRGTPRLGRSGRAGRLLESYGLQAAGGVARGAAAVADSGGVDRLPGRRQGGRWGCRPPHRAGPCACGAGVR